MKLYIHPSSPNARRARIVAHHVGIDVEEVLVDLPGGEGRQAPYRAIHPLGKVPALVDGPTTLFESSAIAAYLAQKAEDPIWPADAGEQAAVLQWLLFAQIHLDRPLGTLVFQALFRPEPDAAAVEAARSEAIPLLSVLESALDGRRWLVGDRLTLADLGVGACFTYAEPARFPLDDAPSVAAWLDRVNGLPALKHTRPQQ